MHVPGGAAVSGRSNAQRRRRRALWVAYAMQNHKVTSDYLRKPGDKLTGGYYRACFDIYWCHPCFVWHYRGSRRYPASLWFVGEHQTRKRAA